jgi:tryptophan synthase alpha chain
MSTAFAKEWKSGNNMATENRLRNTLAQLAAEKKKALVSFLTAGYPDLRSTEEMISILEENGTDIIEIGIPFSDPIADGPTIQYSSQKALENNTSLEDIFALVARIRKKTSIPVVLMGYLNPVYAMGIEKAFRKASAAGVDGFIIPDVLPDGDDTIGTMAKENGLSLIYLVAPNTPDERMRYIDSVSDSFVYIVSSLGVTGKRASFENTIIKYLRRTQKSIRKHPRIIGFGISNAEQVAQLKDHVDGVIVASAIVEIIRTANDIGSRNHGIAKFIRSLRTALN